MNKPEFEIIQLARAALRLWDENKIRPSHAADVALCNMAFEEMRAELERYDANQNDRGIKTLRLKRVSYTEAETFGVLLEDDVPICVTLEDPWRNNERDVSCIPIGSYLCKRKVSPKFGETFEVTGVPSRDHILFHAGNTHLDTHGCILTGVSFGRFSGRNGVVSSRLAFSELLERLKGVQEFQLII